MVIQIQDFNGNIVEQPVAIVEVVHPMQIINSKTHEGIENAKVTLYYFNQRLKTYDFLSEEATSITNPEKSDRYGYVWVTLPVGKYKGEVDVLGYKSRTVDFEIGKDSSNYPTIELTPLPFSISTLFAYIVTSFLDFFNSSKNFLSSLTSTIRFFDLISFTTVLLLVFLTAVATSRRLAVPLALLPYFAFYHLMRIIKRPNHAFIIHGKVISSAGEVVPGALIYISSNGRKVISQTHSSSDGEFLTKIRQAANSKITISKRGFASISKLVGKDKLDSAIILEISQTKRPKGFGIESLRWYTAYLTGSLFEALMLITLLVELLFVMEFGWLKVIPFIIVSLLNILLWAVNARATRSV
jgi:hypothetical protein